MRFVKVLHRVVAPRRR